MEKTNRYATKAPTRGGARPGAGRPKGSKVRYTLEELIEHVEHHAGMSFAERVAMSYVNAINREDWNGVRDYEKTLLGKMVADKQEVTQVESEDAVQAKAEAFAEAIAIIAGKK